MLEADHGKKYPSTLIEEHVSLVSEPGAEYIGHLTPNAKDAKTQANEIYQFFVANGIDKTLRYIGGDSTNVNVGASGGIMHYLYRVSPSDCHVKNRHISASEPLEKLYDGKNEIYLAAVFAHVND